MSSDQRTGTTPVMQGATAVPATPPLESRLPSEFSELKVVWHPEKLQALRDGRVTPPLYVRVKPFNGCDHKCFYCTYHGDFSHIHSDFDKSEKIPREKMEEILDDFKDMRVGAVTFSGGGEPTLYQHIEFAMERALQYSILISMITHGGHLEGRKAELLGQGAWVRVSIDYGDEETFERIRRIPKKFFGKTIENMRSFARTKGNQCQLGVNFVVNEYNYDKILACAQLFRDIGVEYVKFAPAWCPDFEKYHAPFKDAALEQIAEARSTLGSHTFRVGDSFAHYFSNRGLCTRTYGKCFAMQIIPVIGADQNVYACHNKAYDRTGCIGSIAERSFKDLWFSEEARRFFENLDPREACRHECANDGKNIAITQMMACADPKIAAFP